MNTPNRCLTRRSHTDSLIRINDLETRQYNFKQATQSGDFFDALALVQQVYIQEGYVNAETDPGRFRILQHHFHDKTAVFVGKKGMQIAFTVSLFPDSSWKLPMDAIYGEHLDHLRSRGRRIGEVGCLATHPDHRNGSQNILMHGNKIMLRHAMGTLNLDDLLIIVHPRHAPVYKEILLFEDLCPGTVRACPSVNNNPAVALRLNLQTVVERFRQHYQGSRIETDLHHFLFVRDSPNIHPSVRLSKPPCPVQYRQVFPS